ncbi:MAG: cell wall-binding repeat-containing protein [Gallicola sp.]|nr:cell wall-binding repeat-containing protein [Gallicola sp.]
MKSLLKISLYIVLSIMVYAPPSHAAIATERISGKDRYDTAVAMSKYQFSKSDYVILASGENYPDALAGGALAAQEKFPILLTGKTNLPTIVTQELKRLNPKTIYLLGGTAAVSTSVENTLKQNYKVIRVYGPNRYETMIEINKIRYDFANPGWHFMADTSAWVSGTNYPDALSAGPLVGQLYNPGYPEPMFFYLARPGENAQGASMVIGGPSVVYDTAPLSEFHDKIYGPNRYATAVEVAKRYKTTLNKNVDTVFLASGESYPDALASSPLVASRNAALLLTRKNQLPKETRDYLQKQKIQKVVILGGTGAVSENVLQEVQNLNK